MIVKLGIKSVPGSNSSTKFPIPPRAPFHPPKVTKKITAESGAHKMSAISPMKGMLYDAYPMRSIRIQNIREGPCLFISQKYLSLLRKFAAGIHCMLLKYSAVAAQPGSEAVCRLSYLPSEKFSLCRISLCY